MFIDLESQIQEIPDKRWVTQPLNRVFWVGFKKPHKNNKI